VFEDGEFEQETIQLAAGDKVMLYSDGADPVIGGCNEQSEFVFTDEFCEVANLDGDGMMKGFTELLDNKEVMAAEYDDVTALLLEIRSI